MSPILRWMAVLVSACMLCAAAKAERSTVCTITVNSPDERDVLKRTLPAADFEFVELVERGRPDWLESACRRKVRCDVLVISGHFDGGTEFYTDRLDAREYLPVQEMERVACSESCPGLFTQLKEVYLFGCNTLNAEAMRSASSEVARSLVRAGHSPADAERLAAVLSERHGESNRDRMRHIFKDVPVIYGFPGKAPLGRVAGPLLERYLRTGGAFGQGRADPKLLVSFSATAMTATAGMTDADPRAGFRRDVCHFSDDRLTDARKIGFLHELLGRDMAEVRMFIDHIERYASSLGEAAHDSPAVADALRAVARDGNARSRYLEFVRDADDPAVSVRMATVARRIGWLSAAQERELVVETLGRRLASASLGVADVDLACTLNTEGILDAEAAGLRAPAGKGSEAAPAAMLACLGSREARVRVLKALASESEEDVGIVHTYLRHRPLADADELRAMTREVAHMTGGEAQVRALRALADHRLTDRASLEAMARIFASARSVAVQRAVAGVLIRADYAAIATPDLVRTLRRQRLRTAGGEDMVDVLLRRMDATMMRTTALPAAAASAIAE